MRGGAPRPAYNLGALPARVYSVAVGHAHLVAGLGDGWLAAWPLKELVAEERTRGGAGPERNRAADRWRAHVGVVYSVQLVERAKSSGSSRVVLLSGSLDKTLKVWDLAPLLAGSIPRVLAHLRGHTARVRALVATSDRIYSASNDGSVHVWSLRSYQHKASIPAAHKGWVRGLALWMVPSAPLPFTPGGPETPGVGARRSTRLTLASASAR